MSKALARYFGIQKTYSDIWGKTQSAPEETLRAALRAFGVSSVADLRREKIPPVVVVEQGESRCLLVDSAGPWTLREEEGGSLALEPEKVTSTGRFLLRLPSHLPLGYHSLECEGHRCRFIVTPSQAFDPLEQQVWGISAQLYSLRSDRNWGIGDFTDLTHLVQQAASVGAGFVGLNPLHAVPLDKPPIASPYSPYSRTELNFMYLDIEQLPGYDASSLLDQGLRHKLKQVRESPLIEYELVHELKLSVLRKLFPDNLEERLQRECRRQLTAVQEMASKMPLGLYLDLALGCDLDSRDVQSESEMYACEMEMGAPPDAYNLNGQAWGIPPMLPHRLQQVGYEPFIQALRATMQFAGAIRIDHVMSLARLFWVPRGRSAAEGTYVRYPLKDLMGIVCLESHRNRCLVIGEDLGTVPAVITAEMKRRKLYSYKVLFFMQDEQGAFICPSRYGEQALLTTTTHDMANFWGFCRGDDIELRKSLGLFPNDSEYQEQKLARERDLKALGEAIGVEPFELGEQSFHAVLEFVERANCGLVAVPLEDLTRESYQVNLPGVGEGYDSWRYKMQTPVSELRLAERLGGVFRVRSVS